MSNKIFIFRGKPGDDGTDGIDGLDPSDVQYTNTSTPLYNVLTKNHLSKVGNIEFDRTTTAIGLNRHKKYVVAGDYTTTNYIKSSQNFASDWIISSSRATLIGATTDPNGGSAATEFNLDVNTIAETGFAPVLIPTFDLSAPSNKDYAISIYAKVISGSCPTLEYSVGTENFSFGALTGSWQRLTSTKVLANPFAIFGINPKGSIGARVALYACQVEDSHDTTDYILTTGAAAGRLNESDYERESDLGWLIEESKENKISFSGNLEMWTALNVNVGRYSGLDPLELNNQYINLTWASLPDVTLTGNLVGAITPAAQYTVSFWAYLTAGSIFEITVSVGGGTAVAMPTVSTTGFERISVTCTAGATTDFVIAATSSNLTANLNISGVQVETVGLTSYVRTDNIAITRTSDIVTAPYSWNIPNPSLPWTFSFTHNEIINSATKKFIFTNDQIAGDEFSAYFQNGNFIIKNGSTAVSVAAINYNQISVTFDGATIKIYNQRTLIKTESITPSSYVPTGNLYIGMDSSEANALNARLSYFMFYDVKLTDDEIIYLTGV
jgi:hypothetical protein